MPHFLIYLSWYGYLLGLGIGLSTIDPFSEANPLNGLAVGTAIWWAFSNFAALFIGRMVAARMSGLPSNVDGALHGFLAWALYSLVTEYFVSSSIGGVVNGIAGAASGLFGGDDSKQVIVQLNDAKIRDRTKRRRPTKASKNSFSRPSMPGNALTYCPKMFPQTRATSCRNQKKISSSLT